MRILAGIFVIGFLAVPSASGAEPIVVGTYYEDNANYGCTAVENCIASFSAIPAGPPVLLKHAA